MSVVQLNQIFSTLGVKNIEEAERVFLGAFSTIAMLNPGDEIKTNTVNIVKLTDDTFFIESKVSGKEMIDTLDKKRVIRFAG